MTNKYKAIILMLESIRFLLQDGACIHELDNYVDTKINDCLVAIKVNLNV